MNPLVKFLWYNSFVHFFGIVHRQFAAIFYLFLFTYDFSIVDALPQIIESITLSFEYSVVFSVVVVLWYIFTEAGSIIENAGKLGVPIPKFMCKWIAVLKSKIEERE